MIRYDQTKLIFNILPPVDNPGLGSWERHEGQAVEGLLGPGLGEQLHTYRETGPSGQYDGAGGGRHV